MAVDPIGIHDNDVLSSTRGAIFISKAGNIPAVSLLKQFDIEVETLGTDDDLWSNIGHTSNDTLPEFALDGGDATELSTWLKAQFRTRYDETTGTVTFNSVQGDAASLELIYNGVVDTDGGVALSLEKSNNPYAVLILFKDTNINKKFAILMPNVDLTFSNLPALSSGDDGFVEYGVSGTIKTSDALPKDKSGKTTSVKLYPQTALAA
ncbi:phage tail tube protein [Bifidobacterium eulemuris]|uniref:Phage major tail protein n=1 Tax=Bifidobacterium eulemuris TaxID=1765219 RepID=A0A261GA42_9BIFI|nr:hypothetical protein [Bifidobacterium eulemuris]OZG68278.1 hypothetical protein BEUL_1291 [Bifidobacterium eulemuris]QOL31668.1 hypothetical protein BE0216_03720 [Bifidobacterium eulemuris]